MASINRMFQIFLIAVVEIIRKNNNPDTEPNWILRSFETNLQSQFDGVRLHYTFLIRNQIHFTSQWYGRYWYSNDTQTVSMSGVRLYYAFLIHCMQDSLYVVVILS